MNKLVLIAALSAFSAASFAAPETFNVEPTHTYPRFEYSHFGYSNQQQRFDKTSGKIVIDRAAKTGSFRARTFSTRPSTRPSPSSRPR
jgi:polyisoprenoid-binding protein YceI